MDWLSIREFLFDTIKYFITVVLILFTIVYVVSITQVVGSSMYPTLKDGEILILNKLNYRFRNVKRGDIISLKYADTKYLIKRVVGLPGDKIEINNNTLLINGKAYEEKYLDKDMKYENFTLKDIGFEKIPKDMYLVLGDNRENSLDSRKIGLIKKSDINGKISLRFWPLNKVKIFSN